MPPLATPGQRFTARLIDIVILGAIWTVALTATGALQYTMDHPGEQDMGKVTLALIITMALYFGYEGVMLARSGQTLGKKALRIRVAMLSDGNVRPVRAGSARRSTCCRGCSSRCWSARSSGWSTRSHCCGTSRSSAVCTTRPRGPSWCRPCSEWISSPCSERVSRAVSGSAAQ
ncbi:RDD family protein [Streptomyces indonesiensis]